MPHAFVPRLSFVARATVALSLATLACGRLVTEPPAPDRTAAAPSRGASTPDDAAGTLATLATPATPAAIEMPSANDAAPASDASHVSHVSDASDARRDVDGPHAIPLTRDRPIYYALPHATPTDASPWRLVAHLHGICHPPSYSCGKWLGAAVDHGVLVCPTGNARCGDSALGPPSWEAPTWDELVRAMDGDLERSIARVEAKHRGSIHRRGAILTGFSRGAYAAPVIARMHPGRWPYLVLIEANVPLSRASLEKAGVRAVALLAGERGTEIAGERKTAAALTAEGFPVRLFLMEKVAHLYPDDMDRVMGEALAFVVAH